MAYIVDDTSTFTVGSPIEEKKSALGTLLIVGAVTAVTITGIILSRS